MSTKDNLLSGVMYTALAKYSGIVISLVVTAILARLITPEEFGVIAVASIFMNFFSTLTTVGIAPAIVQNKSLTTEDLKSINTFTIYISFVLSLVFILCVPLIASYYDNDIQLKTVLYILSISITTSIAAIVPNALLMKSKQFKFIAMRTFWIQVSMGIVSCICAYAGMGIYALLINPVAGNILLLIVNFIKEPVAVSWRWSNISVKKILGFSIYQMLFNLVYLLYRNIDKILIGKHMSMQTLGYYEKSYRLMLLPLENISTVINPVLHPVLSDYQNDTNYLWNAYLRMIKLLGEIGFYVSVVLYFAAPTIIRVIYGETWEPAIPMFRILSLSVCFQIMQAPIGAILQSINKVRGLLYSSLFILFFITLAIILSIRYDNIILFCYLLTASFVLGFFVYQFFLTYFLKRKLSDLLIAITPAFITNILLFLTLTVIDVYMPINDTLYGFCIFASIAFIYELLMIRLGYMPELQDLIRTLIQKINSSLKF